MISRRVARFLLYIGGLIGGAALIFVPVAGTPLGFLSATLDVIGALSVILFAVAFIVSAIIAIVRKTE